MAERADTQALAVKTDDWPAHATDTIVRTVEKVRDATTGKAVTAGRVVVYGLVAAILGVMALLLITIAVVRVTDAYLPDAWFGETHTWAVYLIFGALFTVAGTILWAKRTPRDEE